MTLDDYKGSEFVLPLEIPVNIWKIIIMDFLGYVSVPPLDFLLVCKAFKNLFMSKDYLSQCLLKLSQDTLVKILCIDSRNELMRNYPEKSHIVTKENCLIDTVNDFKYIINKGFLSFLNKFSGSLYLQTSLIFGDRLSLTIIPGIFYLLSYILIHNKCSKFIWYDQSPANYTRLFFSYLKGHITNYSSFKREDCRYSVESLNQYQSFLQRWKLNFFSNPFNSTAHSISNIDSKRKYRKQYSTSDLSEFGLFNKVTSKIVMNNILRYVKINTSVKLTSNNLNSDLKSAIESTCFVKEAFFQFITNFTQSKIVFSFTGIFFDLLYDASSFDTIKYKSEKKKLSISHYMKVSILFLPFFECSRLRILECHGHLININNILTIMRTAKYLTSLTLHINSMPSELNLESLLDRFSSVQSKHDLFIHELSRRYDIKKASTKKSTLTYCSYHNKIVHTHIKHLHINWLSSIESLTQFIELLILPNLNVFNLYCPKQRSQSIISGSYSNEYERNINNNFLFNLVTLFNDSPLIRYIGIDFPYLDVYLLNTYDSKLKDLKNSLLGISLINLEVLASSLEFLNFLQTILSSSPKIKLWHCLDNKYTNDSSENIIHKRISSKFDFLNITKNLDLLLTSYLPLSTPMSLKNIRKLKISYKFRNVYNEDFLLRFPNLRSVDIGCNCSLEFIKKLLSVCNSNLEKIVISGYIKSDVDSIIDFFKNYFSLKKIQLSREYEKNLLITMKLTNYSFSLREAPKYWILYRDGIHTKVQSFDDENNFNSRDNYTCYFYQEDLLKMSRLTEMASYNQMYTNKSIKELSFIQNVDQLDFIERAKFRNFNFSKDDIYWRKVYFKDPTEGKLFFKSYMLN